MQPQAEKLLRKVIRKSMGKSDIVAAFLRAVEFIRQHGDNGDIALAVMSLDSIEQNVAVMQDYLDDDSTIEIYEGMPVGNVLQAVMTVLEMETFLMAGRIEKLAEIKKSLTHVIAVLHAMVK